MISKTVSKTIQLNTFLQHFDLGNKKESWVAAHDSEIICLNLVPQRCYSPKQMT